MRPGPGLCACGGNYWGYGHVCITEQDLEVRRVAFRTAFANVRRDIWSEREQRLRAQWESYG